MTFFDVEDEYCLSSSDCSILSSSSPSLLNGQSHGITRKANTNYRRPLRPLSLTSMQQSGHCYPSEQQFYVGAQPIFKMAQESFAENRLESVKMLTDLAVEAPSVSYLEQPAFFEQCCQALELLHLDVFPEIRSESEVAIAAYTQRSPLYLQRLQHLKAAAMPNLTSSRNNSLRSITA